MHDGGGGGGISGGHSGGGHSDGGIPSGGYSGGHHGGHSGVGHHSGHSSAGHNSSDAGGLDPSWQLDPGASQLGTADHAPRGRATGTARGLVRTVFGIIIVVFAVYVFVHLASGH